MEIQVLAEEGVKFKFADQNLDAVYTELQLGNEFKELLDTLLERQEPKSIVMKYKGKSYVFGRRLNEKES